MNIVLLLIIVANGFISFKGFNDIYFFRKYEFHIGSIRSGEQYRMFSSAFLHVDIMHLTFNMFTLYMFAPYIIEIFGAYYFVFLYFGSLIAGNVLTLYFHKADYYYRAVGASGAIMGIIYSAILLEPNLYIYGFIPGYIFGFLYLLFSIYGMKAKSDNIGHVAHFGGAIGGFVITLIKYPFLIFEEPITILVLLVPILILYVLVKMKKI